MKKIIKVVGAIIENENGEILCALRSPEMSMPNLWEFPGGKVEEGEELEAAIVREIKEELHCEIQCEDIFNDNTHEYEDIIVNLIAMRCKIKSGTAIAGEHAKLLWLKRESLQSILWAPADIPAVIQLVKERTHDLCR